MQYASSVAIQVTIVLCSGVVSYIVWEWRVDPDGGEGSEASDIIEKHLRTVIATPPMRATAAGEVDESYVDWISRATQKAVAEYEKAGLRT